MITTNGHPVGMPIAPPALAPAPVQQMAPGVLPKPPHRYPHRGGNSIKTKMKNLVKRLCNEGNVNSNGDMGSADVGPGNTTRAYKKLQSEDRRRERQRTKNMSDEQLEKRRMRQRAENLSEEQLEKRRKRQRVSNLSDTQLFKRRSRQRVSQLSDEQLAKRRDRQRQRQRILASQNEGMDGTAIAMSSQHHLQHQHQQHQHQQHQHQHRAHQLLGHGGPISHLAAVQVPYRVDDALHMSQMGHHMNLATLDHQHAMTPLPVPVQVPTDMGYATQLNRQLRRRI